MIVVCSVPKIPNLQHVRCIVSNWVNEAQSDLPAKCTSNYGESTWNFSCRWPGFLSIAVLCTFAAILKCCDTNLNFLCYIFSLSRAPKTNLDVCHPRCVRSVIQSCSLCISIYTYSHKHSNITISLLAPELFF